MESTHRSDSAPFVEFMLLAVREVLATQATDQVTDEVTDQVKRLLLSLGDRFLSATEIMAGLSLAHRPTFRKNYLRPALELGLLEMKYPEIPRHPQQRYRLTAKGRRVRAVLQSP